MLTKSVSRVSQRVPDTGVPEVCPVSRVYRGHGHRDTDTPQLDGHGPGHTQDGPPSAAQAVAEAVARLFEAALNELDAAGDPDWLRHRRTHVSRPGEASSREEEDTVEMQPVAPKTRRFQDRGAGGVAGQPGAGIQQTPRGH